ncbi:MAG: hypothetical protein EAX86_07210 [Candidatus Heimdallarchaeota archaeon]|nr:hypothetical protein [Candidatus Heimdallarchaeota archaeon]
MASPESLTSAITRYYDFNGIFREGDELSFEEVDANLIEVAKALDQEYVGTARVFKIELDSYDEETYSCEIIVGFTLWPYEDDESEEELILKSVSDELEKAGFIQDDTYYLGDGPDIR